MASFVVLGIFTGLIYSLVAIGYTLVYGVLRLINFAHSEVLMSGAFAGYYFLHYTMKTTNVSTTLRVLILIGAVVASGAVGAIVATGIERFAYRPLRRRNAPKLTYLISAIGASFFLSNFAGKAFGHNPSATPQPITSNFSWNVLGAQITAFDVVLLLVTSVLFLAVNTIVSKTKVGRSIRAVAQDAETASLMGVNVNSTIAATFAIGGFMGGVAGLFVAMLTTVDYNIGFTPALLAFTAAVLGGIGNIKGAMAGGVLLGIFMYVPIYWIHQPFYEPVIGFTILVLVLMVRPTGLFGESLGRSA
ncbi:MAG TPA: branched-chain amino acid ABC transporter permease [Acidimicrobiales bacterium]|nr:branched-chain amino acid ABC transporter permease [Acidimicrobiales bacterium]